MFNWIDFFNILFWNFFFFFLALNNFFFLILVSEVLWIVLYCLTSIFSVVLDDLTLLSITFFILGFAALELSLALMILVFLKYLNLSLNFLDNEKAFKKIFFKNFFLISKKKNKSKSRVIKNGKRNNFFFYSARFNVLFNFLVANLTSGMILSKKK